MGAGKLEELRRILGRGTTAEESAEVVGQAVRIAREADAKLASELRPMIEAELYEAARKRPEVLAEIIFPVILPSIRRAISSSIRAMIDEVERIVDKAVSFKTLQWRIEAIRSGRPYAEIAVLRSMKYRIRDVLLIHRATGLLLLRVTSDPEGSEDLAATGPLLVSLQEMLRDTMRTAERQEIDRMEIGNDVLWIEQGPQALLVARVDGPVPRGFREALGDALGAIHGQSAVQLAGFSGDSKYFARFRGTLEKCFAFEPGSTSSKQIRWIAVALLATPLVAALVASAFYLRKNFIDRRLIADLREIPGVFVEPPIREKGESVIRGFYDPSAPSVDDRIRRWRGNAQGRELELTPYLSLEPRVVADRAAAILGAPPTVDIRVTDSTLALSGEAPLGWLENAQEKFRDVPGVARLEDRDLEVTELRDLRNQIEGQKIYFDAQSAELSPWSRDAMASQAADILELRELAARVGREVQVQVIGSADGLSGSRSSNDSLRLERARAAARYLSKKDVPITYAGGARGSEFSYETPYSSLERSAELRLGIG